MIDSIPSTSPAMPVISGMPAPNGQAAVAVTDPAIGTSALPAAASTSLHQPSFADTLQNRLKLMALNKTAMAPAVFSAATKLEKLPELAISFAELAKQTGPLAASIVPPDANDAALSDEESGKAQGNTDSTGDVAAVVPATADPVTAVPLALNVVSLPVQPALPQLPTAPTTNQTTKGNPLQETPVTAINNSGMDKTVEQMPAAVLAAAPEKTALATANQDGDSGNKTFAEVLRNSVPQIGANPMPVQATPAGTTVPVREVATTVATAHWVSDVGSHLNWMVNQRESRADLVLNPPHLGRIEVSLTLNGDQASASFVSGNPEVRDALQGSLTRLREVLADAGVFLGQANIGAESFRQGGNESEKGRKSLDDSISPSAQSLLGFEAGSLSIASSQHANRGRGLIDLFA